MNVPQVKASEKCLAKDTSYPIGPDSLPDLRSSSRKDDVPYVFNADTSSVPGTSDTEDTDDEDEDESVKGGLKSLTKLQRSPQKAQGPKQRRQIKLLDGPGVFKGNSQDRSKEREDAHRNSMRLKPDVSILYRKILSWSYNHSGPDPPFLVHNKPKLSNVPDSFKNHAQYLDVFEPLLLYECWSQIIQSKDDKAEVYACKVVARHFVDFYLNLDISITGSIKKDWYLSETDIVLLYKNDKSQIMGKVISYRQSSFGVQLEVRCFLDNSRADPGLLVNSNWNIRKVFRWDHLNFNF